MLWQVATAVPRLQCQLQLYQFKLLPFFLNILLHLWWVCFLSLIHPTSIKLVLTNISTIFILTTITIVCTWHTSISVYFIHIYIYVTLPQSQPLRITLMCQRSYFSMCHNKAPRYRGVDYIPAHIPCVKMQCEPSRQCVNSISRSACVKSVGYDFFTTSVL